MADYDLSRITDANGDNWNIKAKALESQISIGLTNDVTGSATTTLSGNVSISTVIGDGKVTTSKIGDSQVTAAKIADSTITLDKLAASVYSGSVSDNDSKLSTHAAVKTAIDAAISGQGAYKGKQTCETINTWTAANLNNGDRAICSDAGTLTLGSLTVRAGEDIIFFKSSDGTTAIWQSMDGEFKLKQTAKSSPTASGTSLAFLDSVTQDENGEITATKKTVQDATASQKGVMSVSTGLSVSSGAVSVKYGTSAGTACQGNDSRLSDSRTPKSHTHGNSTNAGALQTTDVAIANGDRLVITDASNSNLVARSSTSFDGSTTTTALTPKGTFEAFAKAADITTAIQALDSNATSTDGTNVQVKVTETDGKITAVNITTDTTLGESDIVTAWETTTSDEKIPSEKLVKAALDGKKNTQTAVSDPTASGTGISYIATISQNTQGVITATKSTVRTATTSQTGVVKLSSTSSSTDESTAATPKGVWTAINTLDVTDTAVTNKFVTAVSETNGKISVSRAQPVIADVSGLSSALNDKEQAFSINYNATEHSLVFSKAFGTVS